jgi:hypothetical protein
MKLKPAEHVHPVVVEAMLIVAANAQLLRRLKLQPLAV